MYRTLIVDDEKWALVGIRKYLDIVPDAFDIIGEAASPAEALDLIIQTQPDLVFTDYRMPGMTGTEMIQRAKDLGSRAEFVVISGYADFEYVQQALRVDVLDYLLKPLDVLHAEALLQSILNKMDKRHLMNDLDLFCLLIADQGSVDDLLRLHMPKRLMPCWQVACFERSSDKKVKLALNTDVPWQDKMLKIGPKKLTWIVNSQEDCHEAVEQALRSAGDQIVCCGTSQCAADVDKLSTLIRTAQDSVYDIFIYPDQRVFSYSLPHHSYVFGLWEQFCRQMQSGKMNAVAASLRQLPDTFRRERLTTADAVSLWNLFADKALSDRPDALWAENLSHMRPHTIVETFGSIDAMAQSLIGLLTEQPGEQDGSTAQHFKKLLQYIDAHYMENLNLQTLSNQYYINVSYCCELFRKETDMTFTQYITSLRMDHAKELLLNTDLPFKLICESVGYNDYFYFDKVFKRNTGLTPTEYRKQYGKK